MDIVKILENSLYFLALLNPASKIFFLASQKPTFTKNKLWRVSLKSTLVAMALLLIFCVVGQFLLETVFKIDLYSLKVAGGIVLFIIGYTAMRKGVFYQNEHTESAEVVEDDITIVPLAAPLIAGPGTITAAISFSAQFGLTSTITALGIAIFINFILMLCSLGINRIFEKLYITGPIVRITGLIVAAVAVQMIFNGTAEWLTSVMKNVIR